MGFFQKPIPPTSLDTDLTGQTIIVTGASAGLGYQSSLQFLRLKAATLIFAVRDIEKGKRARDAVLADDEVQRLNPNADVRIMRLNLVDFQSVIDFADRVLREVKSLHVLLLNAGINLAHFEKSPAGNEMLIQVNYLSNALLSLLLLPLLRRTSQSPSPQSHPHVPTITFVGSLAQAFNSLARSDLHLPSARILPYLADPAHYSRFARYPDSKFLVALFVREMAQHVARGHDVDGNVDTELPLVVVNNVCPGTCDTKIDDNLPFYLRMPLYLNRKLRARSVQEGARALVLAATGGGREASGAYLADGVVSPLPTYAYTDAGIIFGHQLWEETVEMAVALDERAGDGIV